MGEGVILAVRIKGSVGLNADQRTTLNCLRLKRTHTATLLPDTPSVRGMLRHVERYVTWGKPSRKTIIAYLKRAGIDEETLSELGVENIEELAAKLGNDCSLLSKLNLRTARFGPPKGGYKHSVKRPHRYGGEYGVRDEAIDLLMRRIA